MKNKGLKVTLVIGIIILLSIVSFIGFYQKGIYQYEDKLPKYILGDGVTGYRTIVLKPTEPAEETKTEESTTEGEEGEKSQEEQAQETTETTGNTKEMLTEENYEKAKELFRNRLNQMTTESYYTIRLDKSTGKVYIQVLDSTHTDTISSVIVEKGVFEICDADTKEVLLSNAQIKKTNVQYTTGNTGGTVVFLNIEYNKEGKEKLREISKTYVESKDEEGNDTSKKALIRLDGNDLVTTTFDRENTEGSLQLTVGTETTNRSDLQKYLEQASNFSVIIDKEALPIAYEVDENVYNTMPLSKQENTAVLMGAGVLAVILAVYLIVRYHKNGILAVLTIIGIIATQLIFVRYTNVILTAEAISAVVVTIILAVLASLIMVKDVTKDANEAETKKSLKDGMLAMLKILVPGFILSIVFCFMKWLPIYSFGMTLFWGILTIALFMATVMRPLVLGTRK